MQDDIQPKPEWTAGVMYDDGGVVWLRTGHTSKAGNRSWAKRTTAAAKANEYHAALTAKHDNWREGWRDKVRPRKPVAAVVRGPFDGVELANVETPDTRSVGADMWWAVLRPASFGPIIKSMHRSRQEAEHVAAESGCGVGLASTSGVLAYAIEKLAEQPAEAVSA